MNTPIADALKTLQVGDLVLMLGPHRRTCEEYVVMYADSKFLTVGAKRFRRSSGYLVLPKPARYESAITTERTRIIPLCTQAANDLRIQRMVSRYCWTHDGIK